MALRPGPQVLMATNTIPVPVVGPECPPLSMLVVDLELPNPVYYVTVLKTGQLSCHCLFLIRSSVSRQHIARSKKLGFHEIHVQARAGPGDVMAGGGGAAGPAQSIRHQPPGALTRSLTEPDDIYTNILSQLNRH